MRNFIGLLVWVAALFSDALPAAEQIFAAVEAPIGKHTLNPERWRDDTADGKAVVRLTANVSYYRLPVTGAVPADGLVLLRTTYYNDGSAKPFAVGVGAWGSPTITVIPAEKGWCVGEAIFQADTVRKFLQDDTVAIIMSGCGNLPSAPIAKFELLVPEPAHALTLFRNYVTLNTAAAWKAASAFEKVEDYDNKTPLEPSPEDTARGAIPFIRSYLIPVYPASVPVKQERSLQGALRMTPGEYEPFQFGVKALKNLPDCSAAIVGALPNGLEAEVRWVECVPMRTAGGSSSRKWHLQPNRLWPAEIFPVVSVKSGDAQAWFITFKAADNLVAGKYPVIVAVKSGSAVIAQVTVNVTILPFVLPKSVDYAWGFYEGDAIDRWTARDMAEHGCNALSGWPEFRPAVGGKVDFTAWDAYFAMLKEFGLHHSFAWYMGTKDGGYPVKDALGTNGVIEVLKGIEERVKSGKYPKNFCVTIDEACRRDARFKDMKELFGQVQQHAPSLKRFGVSLDRHKDAVAHQGIIDILSCNGDFEPNSAWCKKNSYGMYTYTVFTARSRAAEARYNAGFNPWRYDATGTYGWALRWYQDNPFNDLDSGGSDWGIILPNWIGRPISSPAWEGFREGVDDRRYVEVFAALVKAGKADASLLDKIRTGLKEDKLSGEARVGDSIFEAALNDSVRMETARGQLIDAILKANVK